MAREGHPGRPAIHPSILLALWLYAFCDGIDSAGKLFEQCRYHDVYRWLLGDVRVSERTLSSFRVQSGPRLESLFDLVVSEMKSEGLIDSTEMAQDGMRVRASAGAASYHREETTRRLLEEATSATSGIPKNGSKVAAAARSRAKRDKVARCRRALGEYKKLPEPQKRQKKLKKPRRVSTTAPEVRVTKMGDGGFRPALNVQFATTVKRKVIVGCEVVNAGSDKKQMSPMLAGLSRRDLKPKKYLVDGGFVQLKAITQAHSDGIEVYAPLQKSKGKPVVERKGDTEGVAEWRRRMCTEEAKEYYKQRGATAELVNADIRNHGLAFTVRGMKGARAIVFWAVIAYDMRRWRSLRKTLNTPNEAPVASQGPS